MPKETDEELLDDMTAAEIDFIRYSEIVDCLKDVNGPRGPPLKNANDMYTFFMRYARDHTDDPYNKFSWYPERDGPNGYVRRLDDSIEKAEKSVFEISGDGDFAKSDERMAMYKRKIAGEVVSTVRKAEDGRDETVQTEKKGIQMRFMLDVEEGWLKSLDNFERLVEAGAEIRNFIPGTPYGKSHFGVIDDKMFFSITRQQTPESTISKTVGEPQMEKSIKESTGETIQEMRYAMFTTEHPVVVKTAKGVLKRWWANAEEYEPAVKRLGGFHEEHSVINGANGNGKRY
ncbi:MAG: hypothetical protein V1887_02080 [Candidatus Aenigmatarchaeota archaeon]